MEHAVKPHSLVTVKTTLKALIAVFLVCVYYHNIMHMNSTWLRYFQFQFSQFAVELVSMEYVMLQHSLVTVKTTLKALTAVHPVCKSLCVCAYPPNLLHTLTVCNPPCVNGTCNETTFTCDCMNNFEGSDCSTPSMFHIWTIQMYTLQL